MACLRKQGDLTGSARSQGILSIPLPPGNPHAYSAPRREPAGVRPYWAASPLPQLCLRLSGGKRHPSRNGGCGVQESGTVFDNSVSQISSPLTSGPGLRTRGPQSLRGGTPKMNNPSL